MRKNGGEAKETGFLINLGRLDGRDLMLTEALSHDVQRARQRGIAEGAVRLARKGGPDRANERLFRIGQLHLRFGKGSRNGSDCVTGAVHSLRPPCSRDRSSQRRTLSAWPGSRAQSPPWHPRA